MESYYTLETYENLKKGIKKWCVISICVFAFGLVFLGLSAFLINPKTVILITVIDAVVVSVSFAIAIYFLIEKVIRNISRRNFLYHLLSVERFKGNLKIKKIHKPYLVKKNVVAYEIEVLDDENKLLNCFYESFLPMSFKEGDVIEATLAMNFIVEIGDNQNA